MRVHLVTEGKHRKEMTFQTKYEQMISFIFCDCSHSRAPVKSILYNTPYSRANQFSINLAVELYRMDLEVYAHR